MISYLHNPTMVKVEVSLGGAFLAFIGLCVIAGRLRRSRVTPTFRPEVLVDEPSVEDDVEEIDIEGDVSVPTHALSPPIWTLGIAFAAVFCIVIMAAGAWFGIREYTILQCWYRGESSMSTKDYRSAERLYRKAIGIDADVTKSHLLLAHALLGQQKALSAIPELHIAAEAERNNPAVHLLFGDTLMSVNKPEAAEPMYRQAVAIAPKLSTCYVKLGRCLLAEHRIDDAIIELEYAIRMNSNDASAHAILGGVLLGRGADKEGLAHLTRAVELDPRDISMHNALAMGYANARKFAEAVAEFRVELTLDPDFAIAYFNLGSALEELHDYGGAIGAYQTYLRKAGDTPGAGVGVPRAFEAIERLSAKMKKTGAARNRTP